LGNGNVVTGHRAGRKVSQTPAYVQHYEKVKNNRDEIAASTQAMIEKVPVFKKEPTEKEKVSLESGAQRPLWLSWFWEARPRADNQCIFWLRGTATPRTRYACRSGWNCTQITEKLASSRTLTRISRPGRVRA
jgi:hypothetical protein